MQLTYRGIRYTPTQQFEPTPFQGGDRRVKHSLETQPNWQEYIDLSYQDIFFDPQPQLSFSEVQAAL